MQELEIKVPGFVKLTDVSEESPVFVRAAAVASVTCFGDWPTEIHFQDGKRIEYVTETPAEVCAAITKVLNNDR